MTKVGGRLPEPGSALMACLNNYEATAECATNNVMIVDRLNPDLKCDEHTYDGNPLPCESYTYDGVFQAELA